MPRLVHHLLLERADASPDRIALLLRDQTLTYRELADTAIRFAGQLREFGLQRAERVAIYSEKRFASVAAMWGANIAGGVFVPVNPILKAEQVGYILNDCNVRVLVTTKARMRTLAPALDACSDLKAIVLLDGEEEFGLLPAFQWMKDGPVPDISSP